MDGLLKDVRFALRAIRRAPVFSAIAIGCLAVGIGVNAAAFGVLDAFVIRDYPGVQKQSELFGILVSQDSRWGRTSFKFLSPHDWAAFRDGMPAFASTSVIGTASVGFRATRDPVAARAEFVSGSLFETLGAGSAIGRVIGADDDRTGAPPVAVLGYDVWQREYNGSADVVGKSVFIGSTAFTVIGVAPKGFVGLFPGELTSDPEFGAPYVFLPLASAPLVRVESRYANDEENLDDEWLRFAGRRRADVTTAQIEAQAQAVAAQLAAAYPDARKDARVKVRSQSMLNEPEVVAGFAFVMVVPVMILLVACANLANQLLARAVQRSREIAVRLSLGATRGRLVRQLLVETSMIALFASVGGVIVARLLTGALGVFVAIPFEIPIDQRVFAFTVLLSLITAVAFGLVPALRATRMDLAQSVKEGGKSGGYTRSRLRNALVVLQVTASVALLALAGVFMRGSQHSQVRAGDENTNRLLTVGVDLDLAGYSPAEGRALQARVMERLAAFPGIEAVGLSGSGPTMSYDERPTKVVGGTGDEREYNDVALVKGDWFAANNMRPVAGRLFTAAEARGAQTVAIVDDVAAREMWPGKNAVGQAIRIGEDSTAWLATVVGVVPTIGDMRAAPPEGTIVIPAGDLYSARSYFYLRTRGSATQMRTPVRTVMRDIDPRLPIASVATLGETLATDAAPIRQLATGVGAMGIIAMLLAALGLSALLSFIVEQRRFEIGVRIALGAQVGTVTRMVLGQSLTLTVIGIVLGALIAGASATVLQVLLFGLPPIDPISFGGSAAVILIVALLSSFAPARRAARVDPMVALRAD